MTMRLQISVLLMAIFVSSCQQEDTKIPVIDIDRADTNTQPIHLSQVADSVYYIKLQAPDSVLLTDNIRVQLSHHHLLVNDRGTQSLFLFTNEGRFLTRISSKGNAWQEYAYLSDAVLDETHQRIFILDAAKQRVQIHNLAGDHLQSFPIENKPVRMILFPGKKLLLFTSTGGMNKLMYPHIYLYNYEGKMMAQHYLPEKLKQQDYFGHSVLYNLHGRMHVWQTAADTMMAFEESGELTPTYALHSKKLMPLWCRFSRALFKDQHQQYRQVYQLFETDRYILLDVLLEGKRKALVYDKTTAGCYDLNNSVLSLGNGLNAFVNDLDGGIPFWPNGQVNEQYLYAIISPAAFLSLAGSNQTKNTAHTNPALQQRFIDFANNLKEFDNPVIQVIRMR